MRRICQIVFPLILFYGLCANESDLHRTIQANLLILDTKHAVSLAKEALASYPDSEILHMLAIKSLAENHQDGEMMVQYEIFAKKFPDYAYKQDLLEDMCWGILHIGRISPSLSLQLVSLIGSVLAHDIRAVPFLLQGMRSTNAIIREIAVELSALFRDRVLQDEIVRLFKQESVLDVRVQIIKSVGSLKILALENELMNLLSSPRTNALEKHAAIEALAEMQGTLCKEHLQALLQSQRNGLRLLACALISRFDLQKEAYALIPLFYDPHADVRAASFRSFGLLKQKLAENDKEAARGDLDYHVAVTAAWTALITNDADGEEQMKKWLFHHDPAVREFASGCIASSGHYGINLAQMGLHDSEDPYVKANLALALLTQRTDCNKACAYLDSFLQNNHDNWMWETEGHFRILKKSHLPHNPAIANYPEAMNQIARLEVINTLAILEYPRAMDALKDFLKSCHYGVTGIAAEMLLGEGDDSSLELVRELLNDPDQEIRFQAALVLGTWGKDPCTVPALIGMYNQANREMRIKICEALGRIGSKDTIPFFLERMKDTSLMIRIVSAAMLLQTLNS